MLTALGSMAPGALALLPLLIPAPPQADPVPPPGLVVVKGGRAAIGTPVKTAEEMIQGNEAVRDMIAGETPLVKLEVEDFALMTTEVTNEQYAEFVKAAGAKPPYYWGKKATDEARMNFLEEDGKRRAEAHQRGERVEPGVFEIEQWWDENWRRSEWEVPKDVLAHPVTYVSFANAERYARWAGLRLMTEFEYQYAARGDEEQRWPWGDEWKDGMAATLSPQRDHTSPVGSFPGGERNGVYDLVGNVWEWTMSPYTQYKGYKSLKVRAKGDKRTIEAMAPFDPNFRVVVSGSYASSEMVARITTRQGSDRTQSTDGLGFRCAASLQPGMDAARAILASDVKLRLLPEGTEFYPDGVVIARHWQSTDGVAKSVQQYVDDKDGKVKKVPGELDHYAVIQEYEHFLFLPVQEVAAGSTRELNDDSIANGPVFLGLLGTSRPLAQPELPPGDYYVAYRAKGKLEPPEEGEEAPYDLAQVVGFDADKDCFVFFDLSAQPVAACPAAPLLYERMRAKGSLAVQPYVPPSAEELAKMEEAGTKPPPALDTLRFALAVAGKQRAKGFLFDLTLKLEPEQSPDESWRFGS